MSREGQPGGILGKALEKLEELSGVTVVPSERLDLLEAVDQDYRLLSREVDMLGYQILDYMGGNPQEMNLQSRRKIAQQARLVWMKDPQAGAAVELMCEFVLGRGIPQPRAKDMKVQEVIDEFWSDIDNQEVLTSFEALTALIVDLLIQSNLFFLLFDDGKDGKIKLSMLRFDDVTGYVVHPEKRHRVLYYLVQQTKQKWDFKNNRIQPVANAPTAPTYYAHWRNVDVSLEEDSTLDKPDPKQVGAGKVYHVRINRGTEQVFGVSRFERTIRWLTAFNDFSAARLDMTKAAAALIMKRKIKGTPQQMARDATRLLTRQSALSIGGIDADPSLKQPPRPASILTENDSVQHEAFNLDTRAGNAQQDAQMIRAQISASERFTQAYFGDTSSSSLGTSTSLELPILKRIEHMQEVIESLIRWGTERAIQKAVDDGRIKKQLDPDELKSKAEQEQGLRPLSPDSALREAALQEVALGRELLDIAHVRFMGERETLIASRDSDGQTHYRIVEAYEDQLGDEQDINRDLSFEFSLPNPLRRMMTDLVSSVQTIAQTFDPNNTNTELSRALLTIVLGEALEVSDPASVVEKIFPEGYVDPLIAAGLAQGQGQSQPLQPNGDRSFPKGPDGNSYGAPMNAQRPEDMRSGPYQMAHARGRSGEPIPTRHQLEEHFPSLPDPERVSAEGRRDEVSEMMKQDVIEVALAELDQEAGLLSANGSKK